MQYLGGIRTNQQFRWHQLSIVFGNTVGKEKSIHNIIQQLDVNESMLSMPVTKNIEMDIGYGLLNQS